MYPGERRKDGDDGEDCEVRGRERLRGPNVEEEGRREEQPKKARRHLLGASSAHAQKVARRSCPEKNVLGCKPPDPPPSSLPRAAETHQGLFGAEELARRTRDSSVLRK